MVAANKTHAGFGSLLLLVQSKVRSEAGVFFQHASPGAALHTAERLHLLQGAVKQRGRGVPAKGDQRGAQPGAHVRAQHERGVDGSKGKPQRSPMELKGHRGAAAGRGRGGQLHGIDDDLKRQCAQGRPDAGAAERLTVIQYGDGLTQ